MLKASFPAKRLCSFRSRYKAVVGWWVLATSVFLLLCFIYFKIKMAPLDGHNCFYSCIPRSVILAVLCSTSAVVPVQFRVFTTFP